MKRLTKKYFRIFVVVISSLLVLLIALTFIVNFFFKNQLIRYAIEQLNSQIDAKVDIKEVDFSIWRHFPNASVQFNDVIAQSANSFKKDLTHNKTYDTLLVAKEVFLEFNLWKLLIGNNQLKRLYISNGHLKLVLDKNGKANYSILRPSESKNSNNFNLQLRDVLISNTYLEFNNLKSNFKIVGTTSDLYLKGNFQSKKIDLNLKGILFINELNSNDNLYVVNKKVILNCNVQEENSILKIKDGIIDIAKLNFLLNGEISLGAKPSIMLSIKGNNLSFPVVIANLPAYIGKKLSDYSGSGKIDIIFNMNGLLSFPSIDISVNLHKSVLEENITGIKLKDIEMQVTFSNGLNKCMESSVIKVLKFESNLGNGKISGTAKFNNLLKPEIDLSAFLHLNINDLKNFLKLDTIEILTGTIESDISVKGNLPRINNLEISAFKDLSYSGQAKLSDADFKMKGSNYEFQQVNGTVQLNEDLIFKNISFLIHDNDFLVNGTLSNGLKYFFKQNDNVVLQADVFSRNLDLSKYFVRDSSKKSQEYSRQLLFPEKINFDVKLKVNNFKLNKFNAKWITANVTYKPTMFILKSLSFESLTGRASGNGAVLQDIEKNFIIRGQLNVSRLNMQQLFYTFNNFSQNLVKDYHLKGKVTGNVNFSSEWDNALVLKQDKLMVDADVTINDGELVNFEPLFGLSKFIALDELKSVKFSTLKNHIYIKDKQVIIPQMDINSTAFNIMASGTHNFDGHYNYKVKVLLSDVLWGKARRAKRENTEFGIVEDDGLGKTSLYLSVIGLKNDYKISYDSKNALTSVKESFSKQNKELKTILKEEFGWFKGDTTLTEKKNVKKSNVKVQWDEEDKPKEEPKAETKPVEKKKKTEDKAKIEWE